MVNMQIIKMRIKFMVFWKVVDSKNDRELDTFFEGLITKNKKRRSPSYKDDKKEQCVINQVYFNTKFFGRRSDN